MKELSRVEVEQFWQEQLAPTKPEREPCQPTVASAIPGYSTNRRDDVEPTFQAGMLVTRPWALEPLATPRGARLWVYQFRGRSCPKDGLQEILFVVFSAPFASGLPMLVPAELSRPAQSGRWEALNPRTVAFRPDSGKVEFAELWVYGECFQVKGASDE